MRAKTPAEIDHMRAGGRQLAQILDRLSQKVAAGATGKDIAAAAAAEVKGAGLQPVLLGHQGFPAVICVSVNQALVHGIPTKEPFQNGDVVKLDLTVGYHGMVVDSARTVFVGDQPPADIKRLIDGTRHALDASSHTRAAAVPVEDDADCGNSGSTTMRSQPSSRVSASAIDGLP